MLVNKGDQVKNTQVLIETYWNVNSDLMGWEDEPILRLNRNILECKFEEFYLTLNQVQQS